MSAPEFIAPPDSLLGMLQRGRGEGYRRVLETSRAESQSLLTQCITRDPRLDSQVEAREEYYASIAIDIGLPLEPLAEHLRQNDDPTQGSWATTLTVTTLTQLAKRGYRNAKEILCDYIKWGQWWNWTLNDLLSLPSEDLIQRIAHAVEQHFPDDDGLDEAMRDWPAEQFVKLSRFSPRIAVSISKVSIKSVGADAGLPDLTSLSPRELLDLANEKNYRLLGKAIAKIVGPTDFDLLVSNVSLERPFAAHIALAGLAELAPPSLLEWLAELWLTIPEKGRTYPTQNLTRVIFRQGVSRAILALPSETTLPIARLWITQPDPQMRYLAEKVLQEHATTDDILFLRESLRPMLTDEEAEWGCFMIKAFYNLPNVGVIPELIDIFHRFRFSMGRSYAVEAIQITSPDFFAKNLALECLWDCEEGTRELAVKFTPLESSEAMQRIGKLANDPFESETVRNEAKGRIERTSHL